jgi:hypothetical protein
MLLFTAEGPRSIDDRDVLFHLSRYQRRRLLQRDPGDGERRGNIGPRFDRCRRCATGKARRHDAAADGSLRGQV